MTLLELLRQELPKRGGWPDGVYAVEQDSEGQLFEMESDYCSDFKLKKCDDWITDIVTKQQYESALAESQKPAWNGEGLPPVGAKVEFFINPKFGYRNNWIPDAGTEMEVVAHKTTTDGNDVAVCYWDEGGAGRSCCFVPESLKPLRTEAERKREIAIDAILSDMRTIPCDLALRDEVAVIYDAIAAGKIPGVKLED